MTMTDGKYWVVVGVETLGITDDESKIQKALQDAFLEEFGLPETDRAELTLRMKFDQYRLQRLGMDVPCFYATNEREL